VAAGAAVDVALTVVDGVGVAVAENASGATRTDSKQTPATRFEVTTASDRDRRVSLPPLHLYLEAVGV
jgi:hypothetical protein